MYISLLSCPSRRLLVETSPHILVSLFRLRVKPPSSESVTPSSASSLVQLTAVFYSHVFPPFLTANLSPRVEYFITLSANRLDRDENREPCTVELYKSVVRGLSNPPFTPLSSPNLFHPHEVYPH